MTPHISNAILTGDCAAILNGLTAGLADLIVTDPPYLVGYRDRTGRCLAGDDSAAWLEPSARAMYRALKPDAVCISFYGWTQADRFLAAWRAAGFRPIGHLVFSKTYASRTGYLAARHENAYLLAKGRPARPTTPLPDVLPFPYTGNRLHPTEKPVAALLPLIETFSQPGDLVLDPFCGSGSTLAAAQAAGRRWLGIELDAAYAAGAANRLRAMRVITGRPASGGRP